jgi:hypothetical protein
MPRLAACPLPDRRRGSGVQAGGVDMGGAAHRPGAVPAVAQGRDVRRHRRIRAGGRPCRRSARWPRGEERGWIEVGSLGILPRPVDGMDIDAERVGPQALRIARRLDHDGQDGGPAFGAGELTVLVAPLDQATRKLSTLMRG